MIPGRAHASENAVFYVGVQEWVQRVDTEDPQLITVQPAGSTGTGENGTRPFFM